MLQQCTGLHLRLTSFLFFAVMTVIDGHLGSHWSVLTAGLVVPVLVLTRSATSFDCLGVSSGRHVNGFYGEVCVCWSVG